MHLPLRLFARLLLTVGVAAFAWVIFVQLSYFYRMPRTPDAVAGRVHQFVATRTDVYVTGQELAIGRLANLLGMASGMSMLIGIGLLHRNRQ